MHGISIVFAQVSGNMRTQNLMMGVVEAKIKDLDYSRGNRCSGQRGHRTLVYEDVLSGSKERGKHESKETVHVMRRLQSLSEWV